MRCLSCGHALHAPGACGFGCLCGQPDSRPAHLPFVGVGLLVFLVFWGNALVRGEPWTGQALKWAVIAFFTYVGLRVAWTVLKWLRVLLRNPLEALAQVLAMGLALVAFWYFVKWLFAHTWFLGGRHPLPF